MPTAPSRSRRVAVAATRRFSQYDGGQAGRRLRLRPSRVASVMLRYGRPPAILLSVVLWWLAVVLPGLLCVAGALGHVGTGSGTELTGVLATIWVVGYLVQFALVYVVGYAVGHVRAWWFLVASLLPWVVDWASAVSVGTGLIAIAVAGGFASLMTLLSLRSDALESRGVQVEATVVKVLRNHMNVVINNVY